MILKRYKFTSVGIIDFGQDVTIASLYIITIYYIVNDNLS